MGIVQWSRVYDYSHGRWGKYHLYPLGKLALCGRESRYWSHPDYAPKPPAAECCKQCLQALKARVPDDA